MVSARRGGVLPEVKAWRSIVDESLMGARMVTGLPGFLRQPQTDVATSRAELEQALRDRSRVFLELVRRGIYEYPASPYLPLLREARISYDSCAALVRDHGIEGALERLYDAGVHVTLDEFKGRRPIERGPRNTWEDTKTGRRRLARTSTDTPGRSTAGSPAMT